MLLADILFLAIVAYLLYRFVFNFLLPIVRATHQVRQQFRKMQGGANGFESAGHQHPNPQQKPAQQKPPADDYIDFEEIK
jgi:hypothetical protein